jgi:hypothetical protein
MGFMYRNWQVMGESAGEIGRSAYAIDWLGMGRSARPDPKELYAGKKATVKERVEKVRRDHDRGPLEVILTLVHAGGKLLPRISRVVARSARH